MKKRWQQVRVFIPMAALVVLCLVSVPFALASINNNNSASTTAATQQTQTAAAADSTKPGGAKPKPANRSVLDDEMLDSPVAYFREAFSSEEKEDAGSSPGPDAVTVTVKALFAALLATIL
ncbi:hypothetical protein [Pontibacter russatus]|uniref:hypothetical protein n=1 Tax=Pontibacter russatus TaxID=2694929 RepID=UPI001379E9FF|nr:hypothetical protein [Pontibacter russatus]